MVDDDVTIETVRAQVAVYDRGGPGCDSDDARIARAFLRRMEADVAERERHAELLRAARRLIAEQDDFNTAAVTKPFSFDNRALKAARHALRSAIDAIDVRKNGGAGG